MPHIAVTEDFIQTAVQAHSNMVLRIAYQHLQNRADAEDVVQDVFLRLIRQPAFADDTHLRAWLIRVTINRCKDIKKSAWRRTTVPLEQDYPALQPESRQVMEEIFQLPAADRDILYLYYYEKYTLAEIAAMLDKKLNTVNSRLARARTKLKTILAEGGVDHA